MSELGKELKNTREEKSLSLDDIQASTKIQKHYLQAIEKGDYEQLPGSFYTRAFIKNYAEALGLDPDRLFEEYAEDIPESNRQWQNPLPSRSSHERPQAPSPSKFPALIPKFLAAVAIIGILVVIYLVISHFIPDSGEETESKKTESVGLTENPDVHNNDKPKDEQNKDDGKDASEQNSSAKTDSENSSKHQQKEEQKLEKKETEGNVVHYILKHTDTFQLKLAVTDAKSWIEVRRNNANGKTYEYRMFQKGKTVKHDLSENKKVYVNIGSTSNVKMSINGKSFTFPSDKSTQRFLITYEKGKKES